MFADPAIKWALVTLGAGALLVFLEYSMAKKRNAAEAKKKGKKVPDPLSWTDMQRMKGILGVTIGLAVLVAVLIKLS
jgi:hypothetical protein